MAILPIETPSTPASGPAPAAPVPGRREDPRVRLAQLARLHYEAAETASLANRLGRAPQIAAVLSLSALAVAGWSFGAAPAPQIAVWLALAAAGIAALLRCYTRTIAAPFELFALKAFSGDLSAILFYAGFAWGAGAFLALPAGTGMAGLALFAVGPALLVAALSRAREASLLFLAPVAGLSAIAAVARPLDGLAAAALVLCAGAAIALLSYWLDRISAPEPVPEHALAA
ncbi:MAG TPA: hypothetical protein VMH86_08165 [Rhizomicrobium sp.]|nr:hypothetical protein [Rhizomicrobium sp.]